MLLVTDSQFVALVCVFMLVLGDRIRANRKLCEIALREVNCVENEKHKVRKRKTLPNEAREVEGVGELMVSLHGIFFFSFN